eukprot:1678579-Amphidinium_carterae.1
MLPLAAYGMNNVRILPSKLQTLVSDPGKMWKTLSTLFSTARTGTRKDVKLAYLYSHSGSSCVCEASRSFTCSWAWSVTGSRACFGAQSRGHYCVDGWIGQTQQQSSLS